MILHDPVGLMSPCVPCIEGKHQRLPFKSSGRTANEILEMFHSELCEPMGKTSIGGSVFFVTFIGDASRMVSIYYLKSKYEAFEVSVQAV